MSSSTLDDSTYSSTSEGEDCDTDREPIQDNDPNQLLGQWLGQLQQLEKGLENVPTGNNLRMASKLTIPMPRMDTYRFSMANMEDSQDVELDAILGELCALEDKLDREMLPKSQSASQALGNIYSNNNNSRPAPCPYQVDPKQNQGHNRSNSGGGTRPKFEIGGLQTDMCSDEYLRGQKSDLNLRTESPDNDSAFSDNVSMLSSESSASSGGIRGQSSRSMSSQSSSMSLASSPTQVEQAARLKAEKIKIALEKMKEASIKKLFIKAFSADNSAKSLLIDERMTVGHICKLFSEKNHVTMDPKWALVEQIPELYIERVYEDHEHVVENLLLWTRDSCNRLFFLEKPEKYDLFRNPQKYLLSCTSSEKNMDLDDEAKGLLLEEFFSTNNVGVPEVEGSLYLKSDGKKAWKKHFFVLRASGLYYCPKGKSKLSKDLLCLTTFDMNNVYMGIGWKKKYKAPTDFGFAIKHPQIQTKSSKYIKYLCTEDGKSLRRWMMGIRIAKYGIRLKENYDNLLRDIAEEDLDHLANARSCSVASVAKNAPHLKNSRSFTEYSSNKGLGFDEMDEDPRTTMERLHKLKVIGRQDSIKSSKSNNSNSSGCTSERSSSGTPTTDHLVFDTDFPMGTIKRKPNVTPKIPLTPTTRNLAKQSADDALSSGGSSCNGSLNGSLGRSTCGRLSLRRSKTDDRLTLGSLTRKSPKLNLQDTPPSTLYREDLPPPPPEISNMADCINFDTLPPPPPEAFRNSPTQDFSWMDEPIPPPPCMDSSPELKKYYPAVPPKPGRRGLRRRQSDYDANRHHGLVVVRSKEPDVDAYRSPTRLNKALSKKPDSEVYRKSSDLRANEPDPEAYHSPTRLNNALCKGVDSEVYRKSSDLRSIEPNSEVYYSPARSNNNLEAVRFQEPNSEVYRSPTSSHNNSESNSGMDRANDLYVDPVGTRQEFLDNRLHEPDLNDDRNDDSGEYAEVVNAASPARRRRVSAARLRRTSAPCVPQNLQVYSPTNTLTKSKPSDRKSRSHSKPSPPKRSENTKLSGANAPKRRSSSASAAAADEEYLPETFMKNLQKVMGKKWKLAQQLSNDTGDPDHQILGFRDPNSLPLPGENGCPPPLPVHGEKIRPSKSENKHHGKKHSKKQPPPPPRRNESNKSLNGQ